MRRRQRDFVGGIAETGASHVPLIHHEEVGTAQHGVLPLEASTLQAGALKTAHSSSHSQFSESTRLNLLIQVALQNGSGGVLLRVRRRRHQQRVLCCCIVGSLLELLQLLKSLELAKIEVVHVHGVHVHLRLGIVVHGVHHAVHVGNVGVPSHVLISHAHHSLGGVAANSSAPSQEGRNRVGIVAAVIGVHVVGVATKAQRVPSSVRVGGARKPRWVVAQVHHSTVLGESILIVHHHDH
mmetsp:Transcript_30714/g.51067  ORF Transcript_30714/g.51067 Transcript_30714/m.51067 type:complete len:239 (+) Transcript_30714:936-1652(+)